MTLSLFAASAYVKECSLDKVYFREISLPDQNRVQVGVNTQQDVFWKSLPK